MEKRIYTLTDINEDLIHYHCYWRIVVDSGWEKPLPLPGMMWISKKKSYKSTDRYRT